MFRGPYAKAVVSLGSGVVCVLGFELALRALALLDASAPRDPSPPLHVVVDAPILDALNPEHPEINVRGVRDDEVALPKPKSASRIFVLGDSVAYGTGVPRDRTFANGLERRLAAPRAPLDVVARQALAAEAER